jgi:caffeoyl-CoA O-methyltransferase
MKFDEEDDDDDDEEQVGIVYPRTDRYLHGLLRQRDRVLAEVEEDARKRSVPIIGPLAGNLITIIASSCRAKYGLEIGTATGYSGILLARPIKENSGKLYTVERDPGRANEARKNFEKADLGDTVEVIQGDAKEIIPRLARERKGQFDVILLDVGEKQLYLNLYEPCVDLLRVGGFLMADNVLWGGEVALPSAKGKEVEAIRKFTKTSFEDERMNPVIVPLRDGVLVAQKITN